MSSDCPASGLVGRRRECEALDRLVGKIRVGQSAVLVLRGEPGVGKSALLDYVLAQASGCRVVQVDGVESEMELAFAGLHQLCAPMLDRLEDLPEPQRDTLRVAFGLRAGPSPERFLVGLAVLTLLSAAAAQRPLMCVVDDAQWLDQASVQALAFVARRALAEPVGLVFAVREPSDVPELVGLPELVVEGVGDADARLLLASALRGRLDDRVRDRIIAESRGNPLALLEFPVGQSPAELAGGFGLPDPQPLVSRIEQTFLGRVRSLPSRTQRLLLTAAAEPTGDVALLWRAAERLGISAGAATAAQDAALVEFGTRVHFHHPLVRSAVYRAAPFSERQQVHRALAEVTDPEADPDRRAWHLAHAAIGPDEAVAAELERSAERARAKGGVTAAAAFLQRATELTPDPARRGVRALAAAQAKLDGGAPDAATELVATADLCPLTGLERARLDLLRGQIALAVNRGRDAPPLLLAAAERLAPLEPALARETYLEALFAAMFAGRLDGVRRVAEAARAAPSAAQPPRPVDLLLDGLATRFTDGYAVAVPRLRLALREFCREGGSSRQDDTRWLWLACFSAADLWDEEAPHQLATRAVRLTREAGALTALPLALNLRGIVHLYAGELATAEMLLAEANALTQVIGTAPLSFHMMLAGWQGREARTQALTEATALEATARGSGLAITLTHFATAVLNNGLGRYEQALAAARQACAYDDLGIFGRALIELVEAGARSGRTELAADALRRLLERTRISGTQWALGIQARSQALLSDGPAAEGLYQEAIDRLGRTRSRAHLARAQLLYGEWLRRENRRLDAREQLRTAHDMLGRIGAEAFAERARRELLATGEAVHKPPAEQLSGLTPQEAQIARMARDGHTNPEIGAQLFLSPRTVEWHLRKVFTKLDITSRRELRKALPESEDRVASSV
jgi:DNA-binding CsgD family transcriptional regulator